MKPWWKADAVSLILLVALFVLAAVAWPQTPDQVPVHWNTHGQVDRYGGRFEGLLLIPLMSLGLFTLFAILPLIDPKRANYERFARVYTVVRTAMLGTMFAIQAVIVAKVLGSGVDLGQAMGLIMGAVFALLGNYLPKVQANWFVGIRTPWTLSSERSWHRTHRLGGKLFVASGLVTVIAGLLRPAWAFYAFALTMTPAVIFLLVYSYRVWQQDPDRQGPNGSRP